MSIPAEIQDPTDYIAPGQAMPEFRGRHSMPYELSADGEHKLQAVGDARSNGEAIEAQTVLTEGATPSAKPQAPVINEPSVEAKAGDDLDLAA